MVRKCVFSFYRVFILLVILLCFLTMVLNVSVCNADEIVSIPDPNLEAAIRDKLGKPWGDIYKSDLVGLTSLSAVDRDLDNAIIDLTGLEYCTSLTTL